ncbi:MULTISPECIES: hypothetical protein [Corallococcus]|uniref:Phage tail assembly protein n=1 Tax=Corallococcus llansteffanensis TaxID=2316731 RepID=A0A3A8NR01_9BACT|nr:MULTISPECIES: hypothetical protein [Corallococcus]RKH00542.1 hypothetical protein D7V97_30155 [Corallococcus sp. CA053C]RKH42422.1 hypothetical protein D7V93_37855 [Corallococcus llansteffanensis]
MTALITEFPFTLKLGYADEGGDLHKDGTMRLATAGDEILPLRDPRVQQNPSYLSVILLSRVVTRLGNLPMVSPKVIENLFAADFAMLQDLYNRINERGRDTLDTVCPKCNHAFETDVESHRGP